MILYLAGPMTGYENNNYAAFEIGTIKLRALGYNVITPHEIMEPATEYGDAYDKACREDTIQMLKCDEIATLEGWEKSRGARTETAIGILVGIPNHPIEHYLETHATR